MLVGRAFARTEVGAGGPWNRMNFRFGMVLTSLSLDPLYPLLSLNFLQTESNPESLHIYFNVQSRFPNNYTTAASREKTSEDRLIED